MTVTDEELLSQIEKGLEDVTEWSDADLMRYEHGGGRLAVLRDGERKLVADFYHESDREHLTLCSPPNIRRLLALAREGMRVREAVANINVDEVASSLEEPLWEPAMQRRANEMILITETTRPQMIVAARILHALTGGDNGE